MSEEKLYAVKNGKGEYWDFEDNLRFNRFELASRPLTSSNDLACRAAFKYHGHVVTLVEEPKKVVLSKEEARIVERAHDYTWPAKYITDNCGNSNGLEELLMNAYVNGYTVAKEKKYLVYKELGGKQKNKHEQVAQAYRSNLFFDTIIWLIKEHKIMSSDASDQFTESEIEHYGLQDCEKEEVTDDDE
ncbi:DUF1642 domain-containing protein [Lacticaseibacillus paracasei]|uniref:DUF1642 domain-containing protein n=1 Tax=Lacticaseibacillus paracasei TaxID=1597 RepID=UPI002360CD0C|nr:DUF1642 domain-containing protein [Lacticaseibacillus paracasei]